VSQNFLFKKRIGILDCAKQPKATKLNKIEISRDRMIFPHHKGKGEVNVEKEHEVTALEM